MEIIEFLRQPNQEHWLAELRRCDWYAGAFLLDLLADKTAWDKELGPSTRLFLLVDGDTLIAFGTLSEQDAIRDTALTPWLGFIYTYPAFRGRRHSETIVNHIVAAAAAAGHHVIYLSTHHIGFYEKYGFAFVENRVDEWSDEPVRMYAKRF